MRTTILLWSAASGLVLGLLVGLLLVAVLAVGAELLPPGAARHVGRARGVALVVGLVILPLAGAVLGYLEGRLKLR